MICLAYSSIKNIMPVMMKPVTAPATSCAGVCLFSTYLLHAMGGKSSIYSNPQGQKAMANAMDGPTTPTE